MTFFYYMVNANTMFILSTDSGVNGVGRAEKQSTATFALSSLSGGYAFGSQGDTSRLMQLTVRGDSPRAATALSLPGCSTRCRMELPPPMSRLQELTRLLRMDGWCWTLRKPPMHLRSN